MVVVSRSAAHKLSVFLLYTRAPPPLLLPSVVRDGCFPPSAELVSLSKPVRPKR